MTPDAAPAHPRRVVGCLLPLLTVAFGLLLALLGVLSYVLLLVGPWDDVAQCTAARGLEPGSDLGPVTVTRHFLPAGLTCHWTREPGVTAELFEPSSTWWALGLVVLGVVLVAVPLAVRFARRR